VRVRKVSWNVKLELPFSAGGIVFFPIWGLFPFGVSLFLVFLEESVQMVFFLAAVAPPPKEAISFEPGVDC